MSDESKIKGLRDRVHDAVISYDGNGTELGEACGVSKTTISNWKNGRFNDIKKDHLLALAEASGYRFEYLAKGEEPQMSMAGINERARNVAWLQELAPDELDLLRWFRKSEPEYRKQLLDQARYYRTISATGDPERIAEFERELNPGVDPNRKVSEMTIAELIDTITPPRKDD